MTKSRKLLAISVSFTLVISLSSYSRGAGEVFEMPSGYMPYVDFWLQVFTRYSGKQVLIHDREEPWKILKVLVLDFIDPRDPGAVHDVRDLIDGRVKDLQRVLDDLDRDGPRAVTRSTVHRWIWHLYAIQARQTPDIFRRLKDRLRIQVGMRERMADALKRMDYYYPHVVSVIRRYGLPEDLAYLALVESGYQPFASSSAGARGLWQLMRAAARKNGLVVGRYVDQRYDPIYATEAAMRYLKAAHAEFHSWALAITSYNHGISGIRRALRQVGSRDWMAIVHYYENRRFGFASRNFYAEFLAARHMARYRDVYFPVLPSQPDAVWKYRLLRLPRTMRMRDIPNYLGMHPARFLEYNPQFLLTAFLRNIRIRKGAWLRVPTEPQGTAPVHHVVRPGESLQMIARVYGIPVDRLRAWNPGLEPGHLVPGSRVRLGADGWAPALETR